MLDPLAATAERERERERAREREREREREGPAQQRPLGLGGPPSGPGGGRLLERGRLEAIRRSHLAAVALS